MMAAKTETARRLRRHQTNAERLLWFRLRDRRLAGWKFKRQAPIDRFDVDFFCADAKLEAMGYLVLRFWNHDVIRNMDGVLEEIVSTANPHRSEPPHPTPLPCGERERT